MGRNELSHSLGAGPVQRRVATPVRSERRRGTVLILVVGVLVLVLLIGMALLETTRTENARVAIDKRVVDTDALVQAVVRHVLHLLREDLWGNDNVLLNGNPSVNPLRFGEVLDEPFDGFSNLGLFPDGTFGAQWQGDAWLSSTVPYNADRLVWRRVSWAPLDEGAALMGLAQRLGARGLRSPVGVVDRVRLPLPDDNGGVDFSIFKTLYLDADGDGIRDSVRLPNQFAGTAGQRFDVAIRIVDHGSMLNINTASDTASWPTAPINPPPSNAPEKSDAWGRYVTNLRVEPVLGFNVDLSEFVNRRATDPVTYAERFVRAGLLSGWPMPAYFPADSEASLRYRHLLVPFRTVTGLGRKPVETDFLTTLVGGTPQYRRYNETEPPSQVEPPTWMSRMDPDNPEFVLRPLVTTISKDHQRIAVPRSVVLKPSLLPIGMNLPMLPAVHPQTRERIAAANRFDLVDVNANPFGMAFVRDPSSGRVVQVDPQFPWPDELLGAEEIPPMEGYAGQLAAAMWLVLEGDQVVPNVTDGDDVRFYPGVPVDELTPQRRRRLAWQFAANLIDYRDNEFDYPPDPVTGQRKDPVTVIGPPNGKDVTIPVRDWDSGDRVFGFEPQPFITEVYADVKGTPEAPDYDNSTYAVQLHNPYRVPLPLDGYQIKLERILPPIPPANPQTDSLPTSGVIDLVGLTINPSNHLVLYRLAPALASQDPKQVFVNFVATRFYPFMDLIIPGKNSYVELRRMLPKGTELTVDRLEPPDASFAEGGETQVLQRVWSTFEVTFADLRQLRLFSTTGLVDFIGADVFKRATGGLLGFESPVSGSRPPVPSFFREPGSRGLGQSWTFDSLVDIVNVFLIGPAPTGTVPAFIARAQNYLREPGNVPSQSGLQLTGDGTDVANDDRDGAMAMAGRIDFVNAEWAHRIFDYFSVNRAAYDKVPNDRDAVVDELTEDYDVGRTVAGRLNINTAPARVLRASLTLSSTKDSFDESARAWRSEIIAAFRDGRPLGQLAPPRATLQPYRSVADLTQIDRNWPALTSLHPSLNEHPFRFAFTTGQSDDLQRDRVLKLVANLLTVRSDVYTIYIALVDRNDPQDLDDDVYVRRVQLTVDRTNCYRSSDVLPEIIARQDSGYYDVKR